MEVENGNKVDGVGAATSSTLRKLIAVASIGAGIQFGWALQLSLLTPYVQVLGVPHTWAAFIWLCGPISGMVVQPLVGYFSDRCTSHFGRRRPFILSGAILVAIAVFLIGFAADVGHRAGDSLDRRTPKPRATAVFVVGFWILDVANNMLQGPCRAFLADLSGGDAAKVRTGNAFFSFFMAVGNVLGYSAGSYPNLHKALPFTLTTACDSYCANLKTCFIISITLLLSLTAIALSTVSEPPPIESTTSSLSSPVFGQVKQAVKGFKKPMWILFLVTALTWIGWFPFLLYDTDWMGKEVYGGDVASKDARKVALYHKGVRAGALGLMLNSVVLGFMSLAVEPLARALGGAKRLWGIVNFVLAFGLCMTVVVTKIADSSRPPLALPPAGVKAGALSVFAVLGVPLAITFSIPFALASIFSNDSGAGQGLSLGVLNLAIVIPQMLVSVTSGPLDAHFGGSNLPAFVAGAIAAAVSGILALTLLPPTAADTKTFVIMSH